MHKRVGVGVSAVLAAILGLAPAGCARKPRQQASPSPTASRPPEPPSPPPSAPPRGETAPGVYLAICRGQFGGDFASVQVYRSPAGDVQVLELRPDITKVSHPPTIFYDRDGAEVGVIPERPVVPGSAEALELAAIRTRAVGDATLAETVSCHSLLPRALPAPTP
ncbi:MAG: hypothetical protein IT370_25945 [Deltaproteobacteria bacterium]|nr:hypothetical protein [Deltaproteobacteria bacterium]